MDYRHEIDGLRAIAVFAVIIAHTGLGWLPGGFVGVDVFFVISGFLITKIILRDLESGHFSFRSFYARRARRIFPALFVMLAVTSLFAWAVLLPSELKDFSASVFFSVLFVSNAYFIDFTDYFAPAAYKIPMLHTWSLAIEEQYYLLFPLVALIVWRRFGFTGLCLTVALLLLASFTLSEWGWRNEQRANYFFSPSRFWEILLGSAAGLLTTRRKFPASAPLATLGLVSVFISFFIYDERTPFPSAFALLPTLGTVLVLIYGSGREGFTRLLCWYPLRLLGLVSFSAYLWHQPVFAFSRIVELDPATPLTALALIFLVLSLAFISWRFVEQPFRLKSETALNPPRWQMPALGSVAAALVGVSILGYATTIPILLYPAEDRPVLEMSRLAASDYQRDIGKPFDRRPFDQQSSLPKIAVVGDSYARDFLNVLNEGGVLDRLDTSLWTIAAECAPFFLRGAEEELLRPTWDTNDCREYDRYQSPEMLKAIASADAVVLASRWFPGQLDQIRSTVANLKGATSAAIILVGPKEFGDVSLRRLLRLPAVERAEFRVPIDPELIEMNDALRQLSGLRFIDQIAVFCDQGDLCRQVAPSGRLLSQDGAHLTPTGAGFLSHALGGAEGLYRLLLGSN